MIKVVTDSVASLPKELIEEENIEVVSLFLNEDGHEHVDATMDLDDFYTRIYDMADNPPTSSQPSQSTLEELFESFAKAGHEYLDFYGSFRRLRWRVARCPLCRVAQYQLQVLHDRFIVLWL